jgi:hypothetical protein
MGQKANLGIPGQRGMDTGLASPAAMLQPSFRLFQTPARQGVPSPAQRLNVCGVVSGRPRLPHVGPGRIDPDMHQARHLGLRRAVRQMLPQQCSEPT